MGDGAPSVIAAIWKKPDNPTMAMAADAYDSDLVVERVGAPA
jgi:hypothetical protein